MQLLVETVGKTPCGRVCFRNFVFWYTHKICLLVFLEAVMLYDFISCVFQFRLGKRNYLWLGNVVICPMRLVAL